MYQRTSNKTTSDNKKPTKLASSMWRYEKECMGAHKWGSGHKMCLKVGLHNMGSSKVTSPHDCGCTKPTQFSFAWLLMILVLNAPTKAMPSIYKQS